MHIGWGGKSLRCVVGRHRWQWSADYDGGRVCRCARCGKNGQMQSFPWT